MHELSMAQSVIDAVLEESRKQSAKSVSSIVLSVGEVMQLDLQIFSDSLSSLLQGPLLEGAKLEIQVEKARFSCQKCAFRWGLEKAMEQLRKVEDQLLIREPDSRELPLHFLPGLYSVFIHCPKCGSADITLGEGKEVHLKRLILEKGD